MEVGQNGPTWKLYRAKRQHHDNDDIGNTQTVGQTPGHPLEGASRLGLCHSLIALKSTDVKLPYDDAYSVVVDAYAAPCNVPRVHSEGYMECSSARFCLSLGTICG